MQGESGPQGAFGGLGTHGLDTELLRLRALVEASRLVHSSLDLDELLDNILAASASTVSASRGTVYVCDGVKQELWSRVTAGSERVEIRLPFGRGLAGHTAQSGEALRVDDVREHPLFDPEVDRRTGFTTQNALCTPIRDREGSIVAVIQLLNKPAGFTQDDLTFLQLMGAHVAQALANSQAQRVLMERQRLMKELELAKKIQQLFLPSSLPTIPGLGLAARMISSRQVGGDYYDALPVENGRTLLLLADVSGKGVAAALVMSNLQAALWATADLGFELGQWASHLNDVVFHRLEGSRYVTAFLLLLERDGRHGTYVNAGHPPALIAGSNGGQRLGATGTPLGILPSQRYETGAVELPEGSSLLLYSDGLTEAADDSGEELGVEGLERILGEVAGDEPDAAATRILEAVERFGGAEQDRDDRTLVLLRCTTTSGTGH